MFFFSDRFEALKSTVTTSIGDTALLYYYVYDGSFTLDKYYYNRRESKQNDTIGALSIPFVTQMDEDLYYTIDPEVYTRLIVRGNPLHAVEILKNQSKLLILKLQKKEKYYKRNQCC